MRPRPTHAVAALITIGLVAIALGSDACSSSDPKCANRDAQRATYEACSSAKDELACKNAGGGWTNLSIPSGGLPLAPRMGCRCNVTDTGCPCASKNDCVETCYGESHDRTCESAHGTCGASSRGCRCRIGANGTASNTCID